MQTILLALRNVFRNLRRSILNILALTVGISILFLALGWIEGYNTYIFGTIIDTQTGHLQVLHEDYLDEQTRLPLDLLVRDYEATRSRIAELPEVESAAGRLDFSVQLSVRDLAVRLFARAMDPAHEPEVTSIRHAIQQGSFAPDEPGILLGQALAERLDVATGDTLFLTATDSNGGTNFVDVTLRGIYEFGFGEFDRGTVMLDLATAERLVLTHDEVSAIAVRLAPRVDLEQGRQAVSGAVAQDGHAASRTAYETRTWRAFAQEIVSAIEADMASFTVLIVLIGILIVIGIVNSTSMSVHERTREIGTMRAIGMKRREVRRLFAAESLWIAGIAIVASAIISTPIALWLQISGVDIAGLIPEGFPLPIGDAFYADFRLRHALTALGLGVAASLFSSITAIRRASRVQIVDALRGRR